LAQPVLLVLTVRMDRKDHAVRKVLPDPRAPLVQEAQLALKVRKAQSAHKDRRVIQEQPVPLELPVQPEPRELPDLWDHPV
jgi:hypothetical protein